MSFNQCILILFVVLLRNLINTSTIIIESTATIQSTYETADNQILKIENDLRRDEEQLKMDREKFEEEKKQMQKYIENIDVIRLNVGGQIMMTTRETLTRIPKSILSMMFNGRWEQKLQTDENENIFFDFNPILFRHLLHQLQVYDTNDSIHLFPPSDPSLVIPFKKMIQKLDLNQFLSSEKNIINFNVGGHIITNHRTTFTQISNTTFDTIVSSSDMTRFDNKSDVFIDYDPKVFRHLIHLLREKPSKNICFSRVPSIKERISFKIMLSDFGICRPIPSIHININTKWRQNGTTIAGGNENGNQLNQLSRSEGIYIDHNNQSIYIADCYNHRIVQWKYGQENGQVVAGGNGQGNRMDQLNQPTGVALDKQNDSIIICDWANRRVVRWPRRNGTVGQIIISDIDCYGLTMDYDENLYVSDYKKNEVRQWKIGDKKGTLVAGGNGKGNQLNQLDKPTYMFVDEDHSVYVSDQNNHRVMKWIKGAKEGIVVAGGQGLGNSLTQLSYPQGVIVDHSGNVYVADANNHRIMRWSPGSKAGNVVVGGNGQGKQPDQFNYLRGISFDEQGHLYVTDGNNRVQKFDVYSN